METAQPVEETVLDPNTPVPQADATPPPGDDDPEDGVVEAVSVAGQKMVPLAELIKLRREAKATKAQLAQLQPQIEQAQRVWQEVEEIRPYVEQIRANPDLVRSVQTRQSAPQTIQPEHDQDAIDLAQDMGWYVPQTGELDVARGQRWLQKLDQRAARKAQAEIEPIRQQSVQGQAAVMRQRVAAIRDKTGAPVASEESLNQVFSMVPAELSANPQVAFVLTMAAAGFDKYSGRAPQAVQAQQPARPVADPIYTESVGRRGAAQVSEDLLRIGSRLGLTESELKTSAARTSRAPIALE